MSNYIKTQAKRKRELAKLDKRQAKDQKRAQRRAEQSGAHAETPALNLTPVAQPTPTNARTAVGATSARKPMTLTEAVARWKSMKVARPAKR